MQIRASIRVIKVGEEELVHKVPNNLAMPLDGSGQSHFALTDSILEVHVQVLENYSKDVRKHKLNPL